MGVYIFSWKALKEYLIRDEENSDSSKDFGKDIIPLMLQDQAQLFAYPFEGYWKDVGTIESLWEANMDLLDENNGLNLNDKNWRVYSVNPYQPAQYIAPNAIVKSSLVNEGCAIFGEVEHSVLFYGVQVGEGSVIKDSVIMPNAKIGNHVTIVKSIIGENTVVEDGAIVGGNGETVLIGSNKRVKATSNQKG
jgi:glucose-1-phosphate adenylyltransferase